jgi:EAL domain-containing protein (putative c-di-GMP-specific phosphodiesterase class I)
MYEVFLRMVDATGTLIPTGELFDVADKANLTVKLDKWVLEEAVRILAEQQKQGHKTHFFIKLSDQAIKDAEVLLTLKRQLRTSHVPGERIIIELSESTVNTQIRLAQTFIRQLQANECKSALEHFGTGLNSDATLKHLPVHYVKIDSSFSKGLSTNAENQQAVQNIVKLAQESGKQTIAEAVEDANSLAVLWTSEVDFAQGHYIQEPLDSPEFEFTEE